MADLTATLEAKPILRKTLQRALDEFVTRVGHVNEAPHFLYGVERAVVFGPFITEFSSFAARKRYAEDEVKAFLKARSRGIALYDLDAEIEAREKRVVGDKGR